jgi:hypothetical protein
MPPQSRRFSSGCTFSVWRPPQEIDEGAITGSWHTGNLQAHAIGRLCALHGRRSNLAGASLWYSLAERLLRLTEGVDVYFLANPDGYFGQDDRGLLRAHYAGDLVYKASGYAMLRLFLKLLRNKDGYTAVECGILSSLAVILPKSSHWTSSHRSSHRPRSRIITRPGLRSVIVTR